MVAFRQGDYNQALSFYRKGLLEVVEYSKGGFTSAIFYNLMAQVIAELGQWRRAVILGEASRKILEGGSHPNIPYVTTFEFRTESVLDKLEKSEFEAARTIGRTMTPEEAVEYALNISEF